MEPTRESGCEDARNCIQAWILAHGLDKAMSKAAKECDRIIKAHGKQEPCDYTAASLDAMREFLERHRAAEPN